MIASTNSLIFLLASAGSGKTQRIAQEALSSLQNETPVLAITFTRKAAAELKSRILQLATHENLPPSLIQNLLIKDTLLHTSTIDSFIQRIYQHIAPFFALPTYQDLIVEEADLLQAHQQLLRNLWKKLARKNHYQALQEALTRYQSESGLRLNKAFRDAFETLIKESPFRILILENLLINPPPASSPIIKHLLSDDVLAATEFLPKFTTAKLYALLEEVVRSYREENRTLFLTDLQYVVELVARNAPPLVVLPYRHIKHFLLDEAQDTSLLQWTVIEPLIEELLGNGYCVHVVGDPKQSIYSWRGAELSYFLELQRQGQKLFLSHNYRSKRRIIFFNNLFYQRVLNYLKAQVSKASPKKDSHKIEASNYLIDIYTHHQQKRPRLEPLGRARYKSSERRFFSLFRVRGYTHEAELAQSLRRALELLRRRGIPPHETAFLVRKNEEIGHLRQLLPGYTLQITSHTFGEVPSLYATMELLALLQSAPSALEASPPPTSRLFLEQVGLFPLLKDTLLSSHWPDTPLDWWRAFYALTQGVRRHLPSEGLFWEAFLDHLWNFLEKQVAPTLSLILTWWEEKGHKIAVDIPLSPNTYPVLTIHKAKGLAWQAVIIPYADWGLFKYKAEAQWYSLHKSFSLLTLSATEKSAVIKFVDSLVKLPPSSGVRYHSELPLKVKSTDKRLRPLYAESLKNVVLENLNLHYVATTRPRQALFIYYEVQTKAKPSSFPPKWNELHKNLQ